MKASNGLAPTTGLPLLLLNRLRMVVGDAVPRSWSVPLRLMEKPTPLFERPLVLVADDDPVNLTVTSAMLLLLGIKPLLAADGADAVAIACGLRLDLILMDLQLPVLDGFAATAQIRHFERDPPRTRVPVVAYTSSAIHADDSRVRASGIDAVLHKPADVLELRDCVMRWSSRAGNLAAPALFGKPHQRFG